MSELTMPTRRRLFAVGGLLAALAPLSAVRVDQWMDPVAYVPPTPDYAKPVIEQGFNRHVLVPSSKWRVFGPLGEDGQPVPAFGTRPCDNCLDVHQIDGSLIYTHGCSPAALPVGLVEGFHASFAVTPDAVPLTAVNEMCDLNRHVPHIHDEIEWVDDLSG